MKKEKNDTGQTVIRGWLARDEDGDLHLFRTKPEREYYYSPNGIVSAWLAESIMEFLDKDLFPSLFYDNDPVEVKLVIKERKNMKSMKKMIKSLLSKASERLFRKNTRGTGIEEKIKVDATGAIHIFGDVMVHGNITGMVSEDLGDSFYSDSHLSKSYKKF